jgi:hypothetical protein
MTEPRSFQLRYVGARFEGHRLPLDVLPDLSAFRDLLVSYVKAEWRAAHADRERLPKGFEKSIAFDLVGIKDGSAVPQLQWDRDTAQLLLPDFKDELESLVDNAYDKVLTLIDGANVPVGAVELTSENIRALNRFGSSLLADEKIEFLESRGDDGNVVYLDTSRRKRLITRGRDSYQTRFEDIGTLLGSVINPAGTEGTITINTSEYGPIDVPVSPERVREDFDGSIEADVQFRLMIELGSDDSFRGVVEVYDVDVIDAKVVADLAICRDRIASLRTLNDGWNNGSGKPPTPAAALTASRLIARKPAMAGTYSIFPTEIGGLLFEFSRKGWDFSIEIGPAGLVEIYGTETVGDKEMETDALDASSHEFASEFEKVTGEHG